MKLGGVGRTLESTNEDSKKIYSNKEMGAGNGIICPNDPAIVGIKN